MIPKITKGNDFYGVLLYCEGKEVQLQENENGIVVIPGSERIAIENFEDGSNYYSTIGELTHSFEEWTAKSKRIENGVFHCSLSFSKEDKLDNKQLYDIGKEFMERMGYKDIPVAIYKHNDTDHLHIHIVASRVGGDGKKINDFNDVGNAIKICRELEVKYNLKKVEEKKQTADLAAVVDASVDLLPKRKFKNAVLQNLQYYLNNKRVNQVDVLKDHLLKHNIELVTTDKKGQPLPYNGMLFFRVQEGKRKSLLKGKDFGKGFATNILKKLEQNSKVKETIGESTAVRTVKAKAEKVPNSEVTPAIRSKYSKILYDIYNSIHTDVLVTEDDIKKKFKEHKIDCDINATEKGELKGINFIIEGKRYKASDFKHLNASLSANSIKPHFAPEVSITTFKEHLNNVFAQYKQATGRERLYLSEIHTILNRNNIAITTRGERQFFSFKKAGTTNEVGIDRAYGGLEPFLEQIGYNGKDDLTRYQRNLIKAGKPIVDGLNLQEDLIYKAIVKDDENAIRRQAKYGFQLPINKTELDFLKKPLTSLKQYSEVNNALFRTDTFVQYRKEQLKKDTSLLELVSYLNKRGIAVEITHPKEDDGKKKIGFAFYDIQHPDKKLTSFDTIQAFSSEKLNDAYERLKDDEKERLAKTYSDGLHFSYPSLMVEQLNMLETGQQDLATNTIKHYDQFKEEHAYLQYMQLPEREPAYNKDQFEDIIDTLFNGPRDNSTTTNRGMDEDLFRWGRKWKRRR